MMGLEETAWGKMTVMTMGTFQVFAENDTLTCSCKSNPMFPRKLEFHFFCLSNLFIFGGQICEAFIF